MPPDDDELFWYLGPQRRWVQVVSLLSFAVSAVSLTAFSTSSPWLYPLFAILLVSVASSILSIFTGLNRRRDTRHSHLDRVEESWRNGQAFGAPSVDVLLPSCGEDIEVLRNTYWHVRRMEWSGPLTIWVLDDADSADVRALAAEFGFQYRVRPNRGHMKKAGNLQYAFGLSTGEFLAIFDADFCPRPDFLDHTVPYMDDQQVGIVQTPQFFGTTRAMHWLERTAGATQELFYRWVQPSRDRDKAAICVGTCALYRRSALERTGGFAQIEHSEDVHTGIALTRAGFHVRYVPILVSKGLCPSDLAGFLNQQYRWCNGSIALMASGHASRRPLSIRQRLSFWAGFVYYISTALNVFVLHIPTIVMAVFFAADVRAAHFVPFLGGAWVYFVLMPRVSKSRWRFEVLRVQMAYSFCHAVAIAHRLTGRTAGWVATGAVGRSSHLAKTISRTGAITLGVTLGGMWLAIIRDIALYGLGELWPMLIFLVAYSYVGVPLCREFAQIGFARTRAVVAPALLPVTELAPAPLLALEGAAA